MDYNEAKRGFRFWDRKVGEFSQEIEHIKIQLKQAVEYRAMYAEKKEEWEK